MAEIDLTVLANKRDELLLAEVAAWVHNWQKCIDMAIASHWQKSQHIDSSKIKEWRKRGSQWKPGEFSKMLEKYTVNVCIDSVDFKTLAEEGSNPRTKGLKSSHYLSRVLAQAHSVGHVEKELEEGEAQDLATDFISSPFGFEFKKPQGFLEILIKQIKPRLSSRLQAKISHRDFLDILNELSKETWGDTRRPINEVTLWDWSFIVAALTKAEIARCILANDRRKPKDVQWRLLFICTNGLEYFFSASTIPDLKARQELLADAWNRVKSLLEEEYPLALEVYRDENGSVFVVPDIDNLLGLADSDRNAQTLRELILERFRQGTVRKTPCLALQGEIVPTFKLDSKPWKGQPASQELPPIGEHVGDEATCSVKSDPQWVAAQWCNLPRPQERCTVCGLRPQGPGKKALDRNMCSTCEERRADRSKEWATSQRDQTIWTDEVADINERLALIVGRFDLSHWLNGTFVRTLAVRIPNDQNGHTADKVAKNPSFARIRRIWETTRNFWQEVLPTDQDRKLSESLVGQVLGLAGPRLEIRGTLHPQRSGDTLGPYHAYALVLPHGVKLSAVWDEKKKRFVTADNLDYLSSDRQLGEPVKDVLRSGVLLTVEEPVGYGAKNKVWGTLMIQDVQELPDQYIPAIPILAEPRTFMALVPADKSLEVIKHIKEKYEQEMGKVRNRLPLHLGCIYAHRHTPIRALLDAGRAMLKIPPQAQTWKVKRTKSDGQTLTLELENKGRQIDWHVPLKMGDGVTEDQWYPYAYLEADTEPSDRPRRFQSPNPWTERNGWLVHAADLKEGDSIYFTPSTFDFEFLDTTARRFEIHYDKDGRRPRRTRPFYLEDLDRLEELWKHMKKMKKAQRHQVIHTIEATREAWSWYGPDRGRSTTDENKVFKQFVADTLAGARWPKEHRWSDIPEEWREKLIEAGVRGELADLTELHMEILKE